MKAPSFAKFTFSQATAAVVDRRAFWANDCLVSPQSRDHAKYEGRKYLTLSRPFPTLSSEGNNYWLTKISTLWCSDPIQHLSSPTFKLCIESKAFPPISVQYILTVSSLKQAGWLTFTKVQNNPIAVLANELQLADTKLVVLFSQQEIVCTPIKLALRSSRDYLMSFEVMEGLINTWPVCVGLVPTHFVHRT